MTSLPCQILVQILVNCHLTKSNYIAVSHPIEGCAFLSHHLAAISSLPITRLSIFKILIFLCLFWRRNTMLLRSCFINRQHKLFWAKTYLSIFTLPPVLVHSVLPFLTKIVITLQTRLHHCFLYHMSAVITWHICSRIWIYYFFLDTTYWWHKYI